MKRLRELPANSALLEHAKLLINAAPPMPTSADQMARVRRAIDRAPVRSATALLLRAPAFALAGAVMLFGASAFAAVRMWVEHRATQSSNGAEQLAAAPVLAPRSSDRVSSAPAPVPQLLAADAPTTALREDAQAVRTSDRAKVAKAKEPVRSRVQSSRTQKRKRGRHARGEQRRARSSAPQIAAQPVTTLEPSQLREAEEAAPLAAVARPATTVAERRVEHAEDAAASPEPARFSQAAKRSSDSELVVRAVQTLRRDHDPALASRLLERYRMRNPAGVLAEEVLSLQVEAAVAAGDPGAHSFAREYLARYPDGRYRERASRALAGATP